MTNQASIAYDLLDQARTRADRCIWVQGTTFFAARRLVEAGHGTIIAHGKRRGFFFAN